MIGVDIVDIKRLHRIYDKFGDKFLKRFLTEDEIALSKKKMETVAGFFAAKEAISKALGVGIGKELAFLDIKLYKTDKNAPCFTLPKKVINDFGIIDTSLSITHDGHFAIAAVVIQTNRKSQNRLWH